MPTMTGRERVLAALKGEECDRLCWSPLIDNYFTSSLPAQGFARGSWADAYRLLGADVVERHTPVVRSVEDETIRRTVVETDTQQIERIETPAGALVTERSLNPWEADRHVTRFPIQSVDDLRAWEYVVEHTAFEPDYAACREHARSVGEDGAVSASGPMSPLMQFMETLTGIQGGYFLLADHPAEMQACFDRMFERNQQHYRLLAEGPVDLIIDYEDTSSTILSPAVYRKYCAPALDEYARICHAAGKLFLTHMCGKLSAFNPQLAAGLQDGIESVCPPPTGDIWAYEARRAWGDGKIIFGGLEPAALQRMTVEETTVYVRRILEQMPTFRRFILGTGDATAHATPVANLRAVGEVVRDFGWK